MKKLGKILFCFIMFLTLAKRATAAEQVYLYLGDLIPDVRLHLKTPTKEMNKGMYQIINRNNGSLVYCIEPGVQLYNGYYQAYQMLNMIDFDLTNEQWHDLRLIAMYGYGYQDRTDIRWYVAAQFMIWEYLLEGKGEIYFINGQNERIDAYTEEMNTIKNDIAHHQDLPSFFGEEREITIDARLTDTVTLTDEDNLLQGFDLAYSTLDIQVNGNQMQISFQYPGEFTMYLNKNTGITEIPKIFYRNSSQTVMNRGGVNNVFGTIHFRVDYPEVKVIKKSKEDSSLSLEGAVYGIFTKDGVLEAKITTNEEGIAVLDDLYLGEFYLQELEAPYGYHLNNEKIYFEVKREDVVLEVYDDLIYKEFELEKYLENGDGEYELEKGATFEIIREDTGEVVHTFQTNEYGKYSFSLPYGNYLLRQVTSHEGYLLSQDVKIKVDPESEEKTTIVLRNPLIQGSLFIEKKDADTGEFIKGEAQFQIRNTDTGEFLTIDGEDVFVTIEGQLQIDNISYGNYELIEVSAPEHYVLSEEVYPFSIREDQEKIVMEVKNSLEKGSLLIEKLDYDSLSPLQGVLFGLYDQDQNFIGKYYTDQEGKILLENMLPGIYYLQELASLEGYPLLEGMMEVEIKNNMLNTIKVTNRLEVEVPKTGSDEFLLTILFSACCLLLGALICNHD